MPHTFQSDKQYHIGCRKGDLAEYLLVPGDPDRVPKIVKYWDFAKEISHHREFYSSTGKYKDVPVSALSSGIGPACIAIERVYSSPGLIYANTAAGSAMSAVPARYALILFLSRMATIGMQIIIRKRISGVV